LSGRCTLPICEWHPKLNLVYYIPLPGKLEKYDFFALTLVDKHAKPSPSRVVWMA